MNTKSTKSTVTPRISRQIRLVSYLAMVAVVFGHAYNYADSYLLPTTRLAEGMQVGPMIEFFISNGLVKFSTPAFFMISGYLFFAGVQNFTLSLYLQKIRKRLKTLALPYVFWVLLWSLIGLQMMKLFGNETFPILQEKLGSWPEKALDGFYNLPLPFQFWFIKDLMKMALLSPLIYLLVVCLKAFAVVLFLLLWLLDVSIPHMPAMDGLLFFTAGAFLAVNGTKYGLLSESRPRPRKMLLCVPLCWILACAAYTLISAMASSNPVPDLALVVMCRLCLVFGACSVFILADFFPGWAQKLDESNLPESSFLIFAMHEPMQHMIFQRILSNGGPDSLHLLLYFGLPVAIILLVSGINRILMRAAPRFRALVTGGR